MALVAAEVAEEEAEQTGGIKHRPCRAGAWRRVLDTSESLPAAVVTEEKADSPKQGGQGGVPGVGGQASGGVGGVQSGCVGGGGGNGGNGGYGAGGRGGHSVAVAMVGLKNVTLYGDSDLLFDSPGLGGYGGNQAMPEQNAYPGTGGALEPFDP